MTMMTMMMARLLLFTPHLALALPGAMMDPLLLLLLVMMMTLLLLLLLLLMTMMMTLLLLLLQGPACRHPSREGAPRQVHHHQAAH